MEVTICNSSTKDKTLHVRYNAWTGKVHVEYDGQVLQKVAKNRYIFRDQEGDHVVETKTSTFGGVQLTIFDNVIVIQEPMTMLDKILSMLILIPCIFFGAVGGAIGALGMILYTFVARSIGNGILRFFIGLSIMAGCIVLSVFVGTSIVAMLGLA